MDTGKRRRSRPAKKKRPNKAEEAFLAAWNEYGLSAGTPCRQHQFTTERKFKFDFAWPSIKVAVEIDGFGFGHQSIGQRIKDCDKQNAAVALGWSVLRYTTAHISSQKKREKVVNQVVNTILSKHEHQTTRR